MDEEYIINESDLEYMERLGSGVCGEVYRVALKTKDGRTIEAAAKIFKETKEASDLKSQKEELDFLRKLKHPNIVQFFCAVLYPVTIIVTAYAAKGSLYEYLKKQTRLPVGQMLEWARQATSAVQHLQREDVVHRDIKSSNFVITAYDILKLCDFGLAKNQCWTERTNKERGTIRWMAPEAFVEKVSSKASDVYSLGIVIWELVACELPYSGKEDLSILYAVKVHKLRPEIPPHCPAALKHLLGKCWKENRKKRPSIDEVLHTIEATIQKHQQHEHELSYYKHGKKEVYHVYQLHLAAENAHDALSADVAIPIDNGIVDYSPFSSDSTDKKHVDHNGNVSDVGSVRRGISKRCLRFAFAFIIISLSVIGLAALVFHLLPDADPSECKVPTIANAEFNRVKPIDNGKSLTAEVSCDDGFTWSTHSTMIVCVGGHWNISGNSCNERSSTNGYSPNRVHTRTSDATAVTISSTSSHSTGNQNGLPVYPTAPHHLTPDFEPIIAKPTDSVRDSVSGQGGNSRQASTISRTMRYPQTDHSRDTIYELVINNTPNTDNSVNATIYREGNSTDLAGSVELCVRMNCTTIHFAPSSEQILIQFCFSHPSSEIGGDITYENQMISVMLSNPIEGESVKNSSDNILKIPRDTDVVFFKIVT